MTMWCMEERRSRAARIIPLALSPTALQHGNDLLFRGPVRSYVDARLSDYLEGARL